MVSSRSRDESSAIARELAGSDSRRVGMQDQRVGDAAPHACESQIRVSTRSSTLGLGATQERESERECVHSRSASGRSRHAALSRHSHTLSHTRSLTPSSSKPTHLKSPRDRTLTHTRTRIPATRTHRHTRSSSDDERERKHKHRQDATGGASPAYDTRGARETLIPARKAARELGDARARN